MQIGVVAIAGEEKNNGRVKKLWQSSRTNLFLGRVKEICGLGSMATQQKIHETSTTASSVVSADGSSTTAASSITAGFVDPRWTKLWLKLHPYLSNPSDVHSTIETLMGKVTNKLSPAEITYLQRRVRSQYCLTHSTHGMSPASLEKKPGSMVLSQNDVRIILPASSCLLPGLQSSATSSIDPTETSYLLMSHLNESSWGRVAKFALLSAQKAGLEFNLYNPTLSRTTPFPSSPLPMEEAPREPSGVCFRSFAFLVALALRK